MRFALGTFVALLLMLSTAIIGSGHIALADNHKIRDFSNSGSNQEKTPASGNVSISTTLSKGDRVTLGPNDVSVAAAFCPSGSVVTGGGWGASAAGGGTPSIDILLNVQSGNGWQVQVHNLSDSTIFVTAGATCATINP